MADQIVSYRSSPCYSSSPVVLLATKDPIARLRRDRPIQHSRDAAERQPHGGRILAPLTGPVLNDICGVPPLSHSCEFFADLSLVTARALQYPPDYIFRTFEAGDERSMADQDVARIRGRYASTGHRESIDLGGPSEADVVYVTHPDGGDTKVSNTTLYEMVDTQRGRNDG